MSSQCDLSPDRNTATPSDVDADNDDDDDDDAAPVKKVEVKKVKKKSKGKTRCPAKCLSKGTTSPASYSPTTMVISTTATTIYDSSITSTTTYDSSITATTIYDSSITATTIYDSSITAIPYIMLPPGPIIGPPAVKNAGALSNPGTGPDANQLANLCPATCNPIDPAANKCDITTSCITTGRGKYYCACRAGYRFNNPNAADFGLQFKVEGQPYVYGATSQACSTLCEDQMCSEVPVRQQCA
jgi:hypothetical protein